MTEIVPLLFVGVAKNTEDDQYEFLVNCTKEVLKEETKRYAQISFPEENDDFFSQLDKICLFISEGLSLKKKVLIYSDTGLDRASSICIAFLVKHFRWNLFQSHLRVQRSLPAMKLSERNMALLIKLEEMCQLPTAPSVVISNGDLVPNLVKYSKNSYLPPTTLIPIDDEGYTMSFHLSEPEKFKAFFDQFGFVIVRDIFSKETCKNTIDDIWNYISKADIKRSDQDTWTNRNWRHTGIWSEGIVGSNPLFTQQILLNRQNPKLHELYSKILGREDLLINHDRYGLFRPTALVDNGENWKTTPNIHFDQNPWYFVDAPNSDEVTKLLSSLRYKASMDFITENNYIGVEADNQLYVQGLINLADNKDADGGFQIVPSFRQHMSEWARKSQHLKKLFGMFNTFVMIPETEAIQLQAVRTTMRAGSAILWDQKTAHGSSFNQSNQFRYAQFVRMFPSDIDSQRAEARKAAVQKKISEIGFDSEVSELGSKLFGLKSW